MDLRHALVITALGLLPSGGHAEPAPSALPRPGTKKLLLPRCAEGSHLSVVQAWTRADSGKLGKVRVRGRVDASVGCIDTPEAAAFCVGAMRLAGGYQDGSYVTLTLQGSYQGHKLECTSQGGKQSCPVRIGTTVIAQGRLLSDPTESYVIQVESLCLD